MSCFPMVKCDLTEDIALVESIGSNYYSDISSECQIALSRGGILVSRRFLDGVSFGFHSRWNVR